MSLFSFLRLFTSPEKGSWHSLTCVISSLKKKKIIYLMVLGLTSCGVWDLVP